MIRLFVALKIPEEIISQISEIRQNIYPEGNNFKWEDNSKIHLTLKFIGEVKENLIESIEKELIFLGNFNRIYCEIQRFGFFFKQKNEPRILWLGLKLENTLLTIVEMLNTNLSKFSIPREDKIFKAHLTLLRIKSRVSKDFVDRFLKADPVEINFYATEISLMQSELLSTGSVYKEIKNYFLK